jgi:hypothetical protein
MSERDDLIQRFDWLRNGGVCSPTTRGLLDDAQAMIDGLIREMHARELHHFEVETARANIRGMVAGWEWIPERGDVLAEADAVLATKPAERGSDDG